MEIKGEIGVKVLVSKLLQMGDEKDTTATKRERRCCCASLCPLS
ncbi:MAG: hypothetical protein R2881_07490 [Eubacteriales bacterium]